MLRRTALALALASALSLVACGEEDRREPAQRASGAAPQLDPPQAAEPKPGPPTQGTPDGIVVRVGQRPEGVAIDPGSSTAAVAVLGPPRLVLVDMRSGEVRREVRLPSGARHVSLSRPGGSFLVPCEEADRLVEVSADGERVRETEVGDNPHDAVALGPRIHTADEFSSTMTTLRDGRVLSTVRTDAQPGGIAAVGDRLYLNAVRSYTVEEYEGGDEPRGTGSQSSGLGPSHVATGPEGRIAIGDTRGRALVVYDTRPRLRFRARVPLEGTPVGLAHDGQGTMWVTLSERNEAVPVNLNATRPTVGAPLRSARTPLSVAVDTGTGRLAIASAGDGTLQLVDP
ncbi:MAG: hypothetical protein JWO90_2141 [Solirubrobacterales bacterium]|nr:hypothetical protein [Solirubrobacterales bacterium]